MTGGFSPLRTFLAREDYESVYASCRCADGHALPMPITLDISDAVAATVARVGAALRDAEGVMLAGLTCRMLAARSAGGSDGHRRHDRHDPSGCRPSARTHGNLVRQRRAEAIQPPTHYDSAEPAPHAGRARNEFAKMGWRRVVALQTRNALPGPCSSSTLRASEELEANVAAASRRRHHPAGDVDHSTRVRCYQAVLPIYPRTTAFLSMLPPGHAHGRPGGALARDDPQE